MPRACKAARQTNAASRRSLPRSVLQLVPDGQLQDLNYSLLILLPRYCHEMKCPSSTQYTLLEHDEDGPFKGSSSFLLVMVHAQTFQLPETGATLVEVPSPPGRPGKPRRGSTVKECCKEAKCTALDPKG